ncbi:MAG: glycosyltransferase [bacterium]
MKTPNYKNTEIISVNYNTPELIDQLLTSIRLFYPNFKNIRIIDGTDNNNLLLQTKHIVMKHKVNMDIFKYNIHHGPGMHYGIISSKFDYILIFDSDAIIIKDGILEKYFESWEDGLYAMGNISYVNYFGINPEKDATIPDDSYPIMYCHPNGLFIKKEMYSNYAPFVRHGAPVIATMYDIYLKNLSNKSLKDISDIQKIYLNRGGRGTVNKYGYNL